MATDGILDDLDIAVLLPCYNEAATIAGVVAGFKAALPGARIHVYDNNSTDGTALKAALAGATVTRERRQGKGMWSAACSPTSMPTSTSWPMATALTIRKRHRT